MNSAGADAKLWLAAFPFPNFISAYRWSSSRLCQTSSLSVNPTACDRTTSREGGRFGGFAARRASSGSSCGAAPFRNNFYFAVDVGEITGCLMPHVCRLLFVHHYTP